jgi:HEAT repeat protein
MKHKRRMVGIALGVMLVAGVAWVMLSPRDPLFHGKPESYWITNIAYGMSLTDAQNKEQVQRWRDFGPKGLQVLERGLAPNRGRTYQNFHRRLASILPGPLLRLLPTPPPKTVGGTRHCVADLLCRMGKDAYPAWPAVARALADEDPWVRARAITFFTGPEDDNALLNQMPAREKQKLLPLFIRSLEDGGWSWNPRNNAALALRYYPEHASSFTSALAKAMQDPSPYVRLNSATSLNRVDPAAGSKAGAVGVVAQLLRDPDYQVSGSAAFALRQFQYDADLAVSALIEALHGTNSAVVGASAVWSLEWAFPEHADRIIPELRKAAERTDNAGGYARAAVKSLEANAATKQP